MAKQRSFKELSQIDWGIVTDHPSEIHLVIGCLQRIADAQEAMSKPFIQMSERLEFNQRKVAALLKEIEGHNKSIAGYKSHNTRLNKKLMEVEIELRDLKKSLQTNPLIKEGNNL